MSLTGLEIAGKLRPKAVPLDHWDDAFPPVSNTVDTCDIEDALPGTLPVHRLAPGGQVII